MEVLQEHARPDQSRDEETSNDVAERVKTRKRRHQRELYDARAAPAKKSGKQFPRCFWTRRHDSFHVLETGSGNGEFHQTGSGQLQRKSGTVTSARNSAPEFGASVQELEDFFGDRLDLLNGSQLESALDFSLSDSILAANLCRVDVSFAANTDNVFQKDEASFPLEPETGHLVQKDALRRRTRTRDTCVAPSSVQSLQIQHNRKSSAISKLSLDQEKAAADLSLILLTPNPREHAQTQLASAQISAIPAHVIDLTEDTDHEDRDVEILEAPEFEERIRSRERRCGTRRSRSRTEGEDLRSGDPEQSDGTHQKESEAESRITAPESPESGVIEPESPESRITEPESPESGITEPESPESRVVEPESPESRIPALESPESRITWSLCSHGSGSLGKEHDMRSAERGRSHQDKKDQEPRAQMPRGELHQKGPDSGSQGLESGDPGERIWSHEGEQETECSDSLYHEDDVQKPDDGSGDKRGSYQREQDTECSGPPHHLDLSLGSDDGAQSGVRPQGEEDLDSSEVGKRDESPNQERASRCHNPVPSTESDLETRNSRSGDLGWKSAEVDPGLGCQNQRPVRHQEAEDPGFGAPEKLYRQYREAEDPGFGAPEKLCRQYQEEEDPVRSYQVQRNRSEQEQGSGSSDPDKRNGPQQEYNPGFDDRGRPHQNKQDLKSRDPVERKRSNEEKGPGFSDLEKRRRTHQEEYMYHPGSGDNRRGGPHQKEDHVRKSVTHGKIGLGVWLSCRG